MYLGYDTETGGFDASKHSLLTAFFGLFDDNFQLKSEIHLKLKPDNGAPYVYTEEAMRINKIDLVEHDKVAMPMSEARIVLVRFLRNEIPQGIKPTPVAHNKQFDDRFVQANLLSQEGWNQFVDFQGLCTLNTGVFLKKKGIIPQHQPLKLERLIKYFKLPSPGGYHDARMDTLACMSILQEMLKLGIPVGYPTK
jgi:DNA polymerase III epsilon subunit-like protein